MHTDTPPPLPVSPRPRWPKVLFVVLLAILCVILYALFVPSKATIYIYNDTQDPVYDVTVTWGSANYWGKNAKTFAEIPSNQYVKFHIPTRISNPQRNMGVSVRMSYVWLHDEYDYPDMIPCLMPNSRQTENFRIRGQTAVAHLRYAFAGPSSPVQTGIVRKTPEANP